MLSRYQTGSFATFAFLAGAAAWFAWGVLRIIKQHDSAGWIQCGCCVLALLGFHRDYGNDAG